MRIFISSTFSDLKQHRQMLLDTLMRMGTDVQISAMEYFGASPENPIKLSINKVKEADIYVGIFGWRYGSVDKDSKMSVTELEYRTALTEQMPILLYLLSENYAVRPEAVDTGRNATKIKNLKKEVTEHHTVQFFSTPEDLSRLVATDLHRQLNDSSPLPRHEPKLTGAVDSEINPAHPFIFSHLAKPSPRRDGYYEAHLFIDHYDEDYAVFETIEKVVYQLHETFIMPVLPMQNWRENFSVRLFVWGEFWARATIYFKDHNIKPIILDRYINVTLPKNLQSTG
jgi:hypothetical protein